MITSIFHKITPTLIPRLMPRAACRPISILAEHKLILRPNVVAGCLLEIGNDRDREKKTEYYARSQAQLAHYVQNTIDESYVKPGSKFFVGFVKQTVFYKAESHATKYQVSGGHALAGIADSDLKFVPGTIISKTIASLPEKAKDAIFYDSATEEQVTLDQQDFIVPAKYDTVKGIRPWIHGRELKPGTNVGSHTFLAVIPLSLTTINEKKVKEKIIKQKEEPHYIRLSSACGQAMVRAYTENYEDLPNLTTQEAFEIVLRAILNNHKLIDNILVESGISFSPIELFWLHQEELNNHLDHSPKPR